MKKKVILGLAVVSAVLTLTGCKIDMGATIPFSGLLGDEIKTGSADLYVEVPGCNSYEDSRQPSNSLIKAKNEISQILPDSEFKECFNKKFDSYAHFSVPVAYGPANAVTDTTSQIRVLHNTDKDLAYVEFGPKLRQDLEKATRKPGISGGISPSDLSIRLKIKNDTEKPVQADVAGVFADDFPVIYADSVKFEPGKDWVFKLSDVSTSRLFDPENYAWFLSKIKK